MQEEISLTWPTVAYEGNTSQGAPNPNSQGQSFGQGGFGAPPGPHTAFTTPYMRNTPTPDSPGGWGPPPVPSTLSMPVSRAPSPSASPMGGGGDFTPGPGPFHPTSAPMMGAGNTRLLVRPSELENNDRDSGMSQPGTSHACPMCRLPSYPHIATADCYDFYRLGERTEPSCVEGHFCVPWLTNELVPFHY